MLTRSDQPLEPVAIIDDNRQAAESVGYRLERMGATDLRIIDPPTDPSMESMINAVSDCALVICDHKLNQAFKVNFYGVDLVAEVARRDQVAVLMSGQLPDEMHRIRRRLADIPGFWPREAGLADLDRQVEAAAAVKAGQPFSESKYFRAMIEVDSIGLAGNQPIAWVRIFGSVQPDLLDVPLDLIDPGGRHGPSLEGQAIAAEVNLLEPNARRVRIRNPEGELLVADRLLQDDAT